MLKHSHIMVFLCIKYFDVTSIYEMLSKCNLGIDCELRHLNFSSVYSLEFNGR